MNADTLQALKESIAHWERLASGTKLGGEVVSRGDCALCRRFNYDDMTYGQICVGCPVYEHTGQKGCAGTPYDEVDDVLEDNRWDNPFYYSTLFKEFAQKELDFLKSLLPKEDETKTNPSTT